MNYTYQNLKDLFKELEKDGVIIKCSCATTLRKGYKKCECSGSGYCNAKKS